MHLAHKHAGKGAHEPSCTSALPPAPSKADAGDAASNHGKPNTIIHASKKMYIGNTKNYQALCCCTTAHAMQHMAPARRQASQHLMVPLTPDDSAGAKPPATRQRARTDCLTTVSVIVYTTKHKNHNHGKTRAKHQGRLGRRVPKPNTLSSAPVAPPRRMPGRLSQHEHTAWMRTGSCRRR